MFIEVNKPKGFIFGLDGAFEVEGVLVPPIDLLSSVPEEPLTLNPLIPQIIGSLKQSGNVVLVSRLSEEKLETILSRYPALSDLPIETAQTDTDRSFFGCVINRARIKLNLSPSEAILASSNISDIYQGQQVRVGTIYVGKNETALSPNGENPIPDFIVETEKDLESFLNKKVLGYAGEVYASNLSGGGLISALDIPNVKYPNNPITACGRYLKTSDPRYEKHALSLRIGNGKYQNSRQAMRLGFIVRVLADLFLEGEFDFLTWVPPRTGSKYDHMEKIMEAAKENPTSKDPENFTRDKIRGDLLKCTREYPKQTSVGGYHQRAVNVANVFQASDECRDKTILVVDDVVTSQSTLNEATRAFLDVGAKKVNLAALAYSRGSAIDAPRENLNCPVCNGEMKIRYGKEHGKIFWGCENYFPNQKCKKMINFTDGVRQLNSTICVDDFYSQVYPDVPL